MIGNVKNTMFETYHSISENHLTGYLTEFSYRFNRRFRLGEMISHLAAEAIYTPPILQRLLKVAEIAW